MKFEKLIRGINPVNVIGNIDMEITGVTFNSLEVKDACLFVAIQGYKSDGHQYIQEAAMKGASAIICQVMPVSKHEAVTYIQVGDSRQALSIIACNWYNHPSRELKLVGVTGTNGKTTIATLLYEVHTGLGYKAGILSTIEILINGRKYPSTHTTPNPLEINRWLRLMVDESCEYCFMEVSSHAASQKRIFGLHFAGGIFTNLTHEHLDYHKDFKDYLESKKRFFDQLPAKAFTLVNADDKNGMVMVQNTKADKYRYSLRSMVDYHGKVMELHFEGMRMKINDVELWVRLTGRFNASNILAVYGASALLGHESEEILEQLSKVTPAEGRFDIVKGDAGAIALIDYAHTDDALRNVLETIHEVNTTGREIITVVGAGGDRDKSKRKKIAEVASGLSDKVILTSDNPRSEDPETIIKEMEAGIVSEELFKVLKITDREEAIKTAVMLAGNQGVILVAGKAHEKYQEIRGEKLHFDDKEVVAKYLKVQK